MDISSLKLLHDNNEKLVKFVFDYNYKNCRE